MFIINLYKIFTHEPCQSRQLQPQLSSYNKNLKSKFSVSAALSNQFVVNGLHSRIKSFEAKFISNTNPADKPSAKKSANLPARYGRALTINFHLKQPNLNSPTYRITVLRKDSSFWICLHLVELCSQWGVL